jgi:hypothetical protein
MQSVGQRVIDGVDRRIGDQVLVRFTYGGDAVTKCELTSPPGISGGKCAHRNFRILTRRPNEGHRNDARRPQHTHTYGGTRYHGDSFLALRLDVVLGQVTLEHGAHVVRRQPKLRKSVFMLAEFALRIICHPRTHSSLRFRGEVIAQ